METSRGNSLDERLRVQEKGQLMESLGDYNTSGLPFCKLICPSIGRCTYCQNVRFHIRLRSQIHRLCVRLGEKKPATPQGALF